MMRDHVAALVHFGVQIETPQRGERAMRGRMGADGESGARGRRDRRPGRGPAGPRRPRRSVTVQVERRDDRRTVAAQRREPPLAPRVGVHTQHARVIPPEVVAAAGRVSDNEYGGGKVELPEQGDGVIENPDIRVVEGHRGLAAQVLAAGDAVDEPIEWHHGVRGREPAHLTRERGDRHMQAQGAPDTEVTIRHDVVITEYEPAAAQPPRNSGYAGEPQRTIAQGSQPQGMSQVKSTGTCATSVPLTDSLACNLPTEVLHEIPARGATAPGLAGRLPGVTHAGVSPPLGGA